MSNFVIGLGDWDQLPYILVSPGYWKGFLLNLEFKARLVLLMLLLNYDYTCLLSTCTHLRINIHGSLSNNEFICAVSVTIISANNHVSSTEAAGLRLRQVVHYAGSFELEGQKDTTGLAETKKNVKYCTGKWKDLKRFLFEFCSEYLFRSRLHILVALDLFIRRLGEGGVASHVDESGGGTWQQLRGGGLRRKSRTLWKGLAGVGNGEKNDKRVRGDVPVSVIMRSPLTASCR